jgi:hypothetical protein
MKVTVDFYLMLFLLFPTEKKNGRQTDYDDAISPPSSFVILSLK